MEQFLTTMNAAQQKAVTWNHGSMLVLAGAGSGKTRVLTTRFAWLMSQGIAPSRMMAVTFTNKAAREMQTRLETMLSQQMRGFWVGTFHGLCHRFLRLHAQEAELSPQFSILDSSDQMALMKQVSKQLGVDDGKEHVRAVCRWVNAQKERGMRPNQILMREDAHRAHGMNLAELVEIYARYQTLCEQTQVVDFSELLLRCVELFQTHDALRVHYQQQFQHILVDEFQDTNSLQYQWLRLLSGGGSSVFAVGDDDQSIYGFRGAKLENMRMFLHDFHISEPIALEQNYRSSPNILTAANTVIAHNRSRLGKTLWTQQSEGEPVSIMAFSNEKHEADGIAELILGAHHSGMSWDQIAVLYRTSAQSRLFEQALRFHGIPFHLHGGMRFFEYQEIKAVMAYLHLIFDRHHDVACLRAINFPPRGIGARSLALVQARAKETGQSIWQSLGALSGRASVAGMQFVQLIEHFAQRAVNEPFVAWLRALLRETGIVHYYEQQAEAFGRIEHLNELLNAAAEFSGGQFSEEGAQRIEKVANSSACALEVLPHFLTYSALEGGEVEVDRGQPAVNLMTIHAAKGLEFDTVFLAGVEEDLLPHFNSVRERRIEEERRLMYVAMTRARKKLYLSYAHSRLIQGKKYLAASSMFLKELAQADAVLDYRQFDDVPPTSQSRTVSKEFLDHLLHVRQLSELRRTNEQALQDKNVDEGAVLSPEHCTLGMRVVHARFGLGRIIAQDRSNFARIQVNFADHGIKQLDLKFAKLKRADS